MSARTQPLLMRIIEQEVIKDYHFVANIKLSHAMTYNCLSW